nr:hypothetical protein [Shewanella jiangmenensis]
MKFLKILHWIGVAMVLAAAGLYWGSEAALEVKGMLLISVLGGLGLVLMSPYPVVLVIEWARRQSGD